MVCAAAAAVPSRAPAQVAAPFEQNTRLRSVAEQALSRGATGLDDSGCAPGADEARLRCLVSRRYAGPAFLLNQMLVWGFTGQVISAMLDVAGWAAPWDSDKVVELDEAMAMVPTTGRGL